MRFFPNDHSLYLLIEHLDPTGRMKVLGKTTLYVQGVQCYFDTLINLADWRCLFVAVVIWKASMAVGSQEYLKNNTFERHIMEVAVAMTVNAANLLLID